MLWLLSIIQFVCWYDIGSIASGGVTGYVAGPGYPGIGLRDSFNPNNLELALLPTLYR